MEELNPNEVSGHELALTDSREEANDSHDRCLQGEREDDPHEVFGHQVGCELGNVLHILVELPRRIGQVTVIDWQNDAPDSQEKAGTAAFGLLIGPLDTLTSKHEQIAQDGRHHQQLDDAETDQNGLHGLERHRIVFTLPDLTTILQSQDIHLFELDQDFFDHE